MQHVGIQMSFFLNTPFFSCIWRGVKSADCSFIPHRITESVVSMFTVYQHRNPKGHYMKLGLFRLVYLLAVFCSGLGSLLKMEPLSHL